MGTAETWPARDGYPLSVVVFEPDAAVTANVLIAGATGVPARFYQRFAHYLRTQNMRAIIFDYRGIGRSLHGGIHAIDAGMRDWAEQDLAGVIDQLRSRFPGPPLAVIGHSAGGQLVALVDNNHHVDALLLVAAQSGYWRLWPRRHRYLLGALWYAVMPGLTRLLGYFPARRLGLGENLPGGVAREWSHWCRHPAYFVEANGDPMRLNLQAFTQPLISYSIDDDWMAPCAAVDALYARFADAARQRQHVHPTDCGARRLGHFGFFREPGRRTLWPAAAGWISQAIMPARRPVCCSLPRDRQ